MFFTGTGVRVSASVHAGTQPPWEQTPQEQTYPLEQTPAQEQTPPGSRDPPEQTPRGPDTPPGTDTPLGADTLRDMATAADGTLQNVISCTNPPPGWEITNMNCMDINVNNKCLKFTCYQFLWLSAENGKKKNIIFTRTDVSHSKQSKLRLDAKGIHFLHFSFENRNLLFPSFLNISWRPLYVPEGYGLVVTVV